MDPKKIVIVGGGFAGINLANRLADDNRFHITLVDRNNYNFFPPLLYQVATGFLEVSNISYPFRKLFRGKRNVSYRMAEFLRVDAGENRVILSNGELTYDYLVFATGTETNYFGMENVRKNAIPMKTINDAVSMRNVLLQRMERATVIEDPEEKRRLLTIVVAGAGPTGVELSGMFAEMRKNVILKEYPEFEGAGAKIYLVDGGSKVLAAMSEKSQQDSYEDLVKIGVEVKLNMQVKDFDGNIVTFANGETIETNTVIWAAGVTATRFEGLPAEAFGRGNRLMVDRYNKLRGSENIYAIGDTCISTEDPGFPQGHPQVAQVAIQQGQNLARNFKSALSGRTLSEFRYFDKGSMAIISRNRAVADIFKLHFKGFIAWFMWLFVHLMSLINYRNRLATLYNWAWAYFTKDQSLRFIIRPDPKPHDERVITGAAK
ncbi:MAG: NADH dehydrogenase [Cytophagaceae bacterium SCN 52-12]|nr:MAG: NADH dehydrogenase [Cytophagaceae bacterium SCN 52-12]